MEEHRSGKPERKRKTHTFYALLRTVCSTLVMEELMVYSSLTHLHCYTWSKPPSLLPWLASLAHPHRSLNDALQICSQSMMFLCLSSDSFYVTQSYKVKAQITSWRALHTPACVTRSVFLLHCSLSSATLCLWSLSNRLETFALSSSLSSEDSFRSTST